MYNKSGLSSLITRRKKITKKTLELRNIVYIFKKYLMEKKQSESQKIKK